LLQPVVILLQICEVLESWGKQLLTLWLWISSSSKLKTCTSER